MEDEILHILWTKATEEPAYNKRQWIELEKLVWDGITAQKRLKQSRSAIRFSTAAVVISFVSQLICLYAYF